MPEFGVLGIAVVDNHMVTSFSPALKTYKLRMT